VATGFKVTAGTGVVATAEVADAVAFEELALDEAPTAAGVATFDRSNAVASQNVPPTTSASRPATGASDRTRSLGGLPAWSLTP
jgi:hypothetical protein